MSDVDLDELRAELDEFAAPEKKTGRSAREERVIAGFEDIQRFVDTHGRLPQHGADRDIFERLYAVRLDRLRTLAECRAILAPFDRQDLLQDAAAAAYAIPEVLDDEVLLAELGGRADESDINRLLHVRPHVERQAAEEVADRQPCSDFADFKPLFAAVQDDLSTGVRTTRKFVRDAGFSRADIKAGEFFILGGQTAYVAKVGDPIKAPNGQVDARLRVVYSNGTESDLLLRSLQRALYKDEAGRRITEPTAGPLFSGETDEDDEASGTIYVLRSKSENPEITAHRDILHKIGVTGGDIRRRVANASLDPTFLMADVEVVATYKLYNINRIRLEGLIHRVFDRARLEVEVKDRFGHPVIPNEWFLTPLFIIEEVVNRIRDGSITQFAYDPATASLNRIAA